MFKNKIKKGIAMGLATVALCTSTVPAMAAEIEPRTSEDAVWQFEISDATTWHSLGQARKKADYTKVYVSWSTGGAVGSMQSRVFGSEYIGSTKYDCGTRTAGTYHTYYIPGLGKYSLTNYVKENKFDYAEVRVCGTGKTGYVSGAWSPDSVGSYTVIS